MNDMVETTNSVVQVIERAVLNPDLDVEKMERILAMQERVMAKQAENAFNDAMIKAQQEMPIIEADGENKQTNSKYARFETLNKAVKPIYTANGFDVMFGMGKSDIQDFLRIVADVSHTAGHSKQFFIDLPPDDTGIKGTKNKTLVHATASAMSYGKRYLLAMIFNLTIGGEDDDGNSAGGDSRSAMEVAQEHIDYMAVVREWWPSISAIKESIATQEYSVGVEAVAEIPDDIKRTLWKAPTKGGIFTTDERAVMKSDPWHEAREEYYGRAS